MPDINRIKSETITQDIAFTNEDTKYNKMNLASEVETPKS